MFCLIIAVFKFNQLQSKETLLLQKLVLQFQKQLKKCSSSKVSLTLMPEEFYFSEMEGLVETWD